MDQFLLHPQSWGFIASAFVIAFAMFYKAIQTISNDMRKDGVDSSPVINMENMILTPPFTHHVVSDDDRLEKIEAKVNSLKNS